MQVKELYESGSKSSIEYQINTWIQNRSNKIRVIDIKYSVVYDPDTQGMKSSVLILWEKKE